jgi:hypothetical protein
MYGLWLFLCCALNLFLSTRGFLLSLPLCLLVASALDSLFASLPVVCSLIKLPLLRASPSNHGLPVEVEFPILFPRHSTYVHDGSTVIPVLSLAPARLKSYWALPRTRSLAWWINTGLCQSLLPYVINCLLIVVDTFPRAFPTNLIVDMILLSYPRLLYKLIRHCDW